MTPLNISIGNLFPGMQGAGGPAAPIEIIPVAAWNTPINSNVSGNASHRVWRLVNSIGLSDEIYLLSGGFTGNAALSGGDMGMVCRMPQLPITDADMWAEALSEQNWLGGAGDWMGISVRHDQVTATYYGVWINADGGDWQLTKKVSGSETLLDSGTGLSTGPGHWYRLEAEGTNIRFYADDVELASVTDGAITTANEGIGYIGDGFELNQGFVNLRGGPLPVPANPSFLYNEWVSNLMAVEIGNCLTTGTPGELWDANDAPGQAHNAAAHDIGTSTNGHYAEADLGEIRRLVAMRTDGASTAGSWKDVNVKAKVLETDDWTTICTLGVMSREGESGWHYLYMDTIMDARYVRFEAIPSVGDAGIISNEVEFWCGDLDVSSMWFVDGVSVNHGDADRAWLFTEHFQEVNARASLVHPSTTWSVDPIIGDVPWTVDGGYAYDGTNYHEIDLKAIAGREETYIIRVSALGIDGTKPVFGDENVAGEITIMATDGTSILIRARSDDYDLTVADATADMVIAIAGDQLYVDGSLITTLVNPTTNAGAQNLHLGGVWDAAGSGTVKACAIYNRQLTATEVASITTRMEAL